MGELVVDRPCLQRVQGVLLRALIGEAMFCAWPRP